MRRLLQILQQGAWLGCLVFLVSCSTVKQVQPQASEVRFYIAVDGMDEQIELEPAITKMPLSGLPFLFYPTPCLSQAHVSDVKLMASDLGPCLLFSFTPQGADLLESFTTQSTTRRLLLFVDDEPLGFIPITSPVKDGVLFVFVEVQEPELERYLSRIRYSIKRYSRL